MRKLISYILLLACILYTVTQIESTCGCDKSGCTCNTLTPKSLNIEDRAYPYHQQHEPTNYDSFYPKKLHTDSNNEPPYYANYKQSPAPAEYRHEQHPVFYNKEPQYNNHYDEQYKRADAISLGLAYEALYDDKHKKIPEFQIHHGKVNVHYQPKTTDQYPNVTPHEENLYQINKDIIGLKKPTAYNHIDQYSSSDCIEDIEERMANLAYLKEIGIPTYDKLGYKLDDFENAEFDEVKVDDKEEYPQVNHKPHYYQQPLQGEHQQYYQPHVMNHQNQYNNGHQHQPQHYPYHHHQATTTGNLPPKYDYQNAEIISKKPQSCGCQAPTTTLNEY